LASRYAHTWVLGDSVARQRQFYYLAESVQAGRAVGLTAVLGDFDSLYEARAAIPEVAKYWDPWMQLHNINLETKVAPMFTLLQSSDRIDVLDWCGNTGGNAIRIARAYVNAHITVLDLPAQCAKADVAIAAAGLQTRIQTLPRDLLELPLSLGSSLYDAVYMIHTIREWSYESLARFFRAVFVALRSGGVVLIDMLSGHQHGHYEPNIFLPGPAYFLASASHEQHDKYYGDVMNILVTAGFRQDAFHFSTNAGEIIDSWPEEGANLIAVK